MNFLEDFASIVKPDSSSETRIRFKGKRYLLIGDMENGGAIATKKQYENGNVSYAYLFRDGKVRRFTETIGTRDDITPEKNNG